MRPEWVAGGSELDGAKPCQCDLNVRLLLPLPDRFFSRGPFSSRAEVHNHGALGMYRTIYAKAESAARLQMPRQPCPGPETARPHYRSSERSPYWPRGRIKILEPPEDHEDLALAIPGRYRQRRELDMFAREGLGQNPAQVAPIKPPVGIFPVLSPWRWTSEYRRP